MHYAVAINYARSIAHLAGDSLLRHQSADYVPGSGYVAVAEG